jgi:hypothetical protein
VGGAEPELVERAAEWRPRGPLRKPWQYESTPVRLDWLEAEHPDFHARLLEAEERGSFAATSSSAPPVRLTDPFTFCAYAVDVGDRSLGSARRLVVDELFELAVALGERLVDGDRPELRRSLADRGGA